MPANDTIFQRIDKATEHELNAICEKLGVERSGDKSLDRAAISEDYRAAARHSVSAALGKLLGRDKHGFPYKQILIDVADKLKPGLGWTEYKCDDDHAEEEIEDAIIQMIAKRVDEKLAKMSEKERKDKAEEIEKAMDQLAAQDDALKRTLDQSMKTQVAGAIVSGGVGTLFATPAVAAALFYSGFWGGMSAMVFGVSGAAVAASATVVLLPAVLVSAAALAGGPAFRKTIPVTLVLIGIRKRIEAEKELA